MLASVFIPVKLKVPVWLEHPLYFARNCVAYNLEKHTWYGAKIAIISMKSPRSASWHSVGSIPLPAKCTSLSRWSSSTTVVCFNYKAPVVWSFDTLCHLTLMSVSKINHLRTFSMYSLIGRDYGQLVQEFVTVISFTSKKATVFSWELSCFVSALWQLKWN